MITSEESNVSWVLNFETKQKLDGLDRVVSSINEVSHEDVPGIGQLTSLFEELQYIMKLAMEVSTDGNRSSDGLDIVLFN